MKAALITGASAAIAYVSIMVVHITREYQHERATRQAWHMYRSTH
jgi:hypothetical protein